LIVKRVVESYGKTLKALVLFGSYVYNPLKSRDIDILLIVDKLVNAKEKLAIEVEVARNVKALCRKPVDVIVFDIDMLKENAEPGGIVSGLVIGYKILYDDIGMQKIVEGVADKISREESYIIIKNNRRIDLSAIAKHLKKR